MTFVLHDRRGDKPAGDDSYRIYRDLHSYDKTDLKAAVESGDDTAPYWRRERITFEAAYGSERMVAVKIPVLMLNGRDDFFFPEEASQLPLFRLIGTPERDKKRVRYDGAHNVYARLDLARDMLDWLDRYLGPVDVKR